MVVGRGTGSNRDEFVSDKDMPIRLSTEPVDLAEPFERYGPGLLRYVRRRIDVEGADDLVAEVFTAAFAQRHRFNAARGAVGPWLYGSPLGSYGRTEGLRGENSAHSRVPYLTPL